jgi:hypothetical protein
VHSGDRDEVGKPGKSPLSTVWRTIQMLDDNAWQVVRDGGPMQFSRWLAAVLIVAVYLPDGSDSRHYIYVGAIVALLLFPDAQSIGFGGMKFERLRNEVRQQAAEIAKMNQKVSIASEVRQNFYLTATQAGVVKGELAAEAAKGEEAPSESREAVGKFLSPGSS